jgi:hypothetical protein
MGRITRDSTAADTGVIAGAGVAVSAIAIGTTLGARAAAAIGCGPRTAGGGRGAVAVVLAVSDTTDRSGSCCTATLAAHSRAMGSITGAFVRRRAVRSKDLCAPMSTIAIGRIASTLDLIAQDSAHTA